MSGISVVSKQVPWERLAAVIPLQDNSEAVLGHAPQKLAEPRNTAEAAAILKWANENQVAVVPRGGGSKLTWGNPPTRAELMLSTRALSRVLEHAWQDLVVTVEAGCTIAELQRTVAEHGQRLVIDPLLPERATVGGVLAANDNGSLRTRFGSLRDLVIGVTVALPDGTVAMSGGKVVKNVAGYDLPKLFAGSLGTLGVIVQANFRCHPLPAQTRTLTFQCAALPDANTSLLALQSSTLVHSSLQLRAARQQPSFLDVRFEGTATGIDAQVQRTPPLVTGRQIDDQPDSWMKREHMWANADAAACLCRLSVLPSRIAETGAVMDRLAAELNLGWELVIQAVGVGLLRFDGEALALAKAVARLRAEVERGGGSLVLLRCPDELRQRVDAWGSAGSALPLMIRVKQQFDPAGIMNPGRFVGGI